MFYITQDPDKDRFDLTKFMENLDGAFDILGSHFLEELVKLPLEGIYKIRSEEKNPALLSYNIYHDIQYYMILMAYNGISDFTSMKVGDKIAYPSISSLERLYFSLNSASKVK